MRVADLEFTTVQPAGAHIMRSAQRNIEVYVVHPVMRANNNH